jgi:hypothetical protein
MVAPVLLLLSQTPAAATSTRHPPPALAVLETSGQVEREADATEVLFVYSATTYRHRRAPESESPTGERIDIIETRHECKCIRFADYSRVKMNKIREIAITYPPDGHKAVVRVTRRNGDVNEYRANELYGGDGLFPPRFAVTIDGQVREFGLVLEDRPGAAWPDELLTRILLVRPPPPKPAAPPKHHKP